MTSEIAWFHENGELHLCDAFGCLGPAVSLWSIEEGTGIGGYHLCRLHTDELALIVDDAINPDRHKQHDLGLFP